MANKKILICDDDEGILDMLGFLLEDSGYSAIPVNNSLMIYEEIRNTHPDLVLLDLWMPVLSGDQVLRSLRSSPDTKNLPVIIISASRDGKQIAEKAGADAYIAKPFDLEDLVNQVQELLR